MPMRALRNWRPAQNTVKTTRKMQAARAITVLGRSPSDSVLADSVSESGEDLQTVAHFISKLLVDKAAAPLVKSGGEWQEGERMIRSASQIVPAPSAGLPREFVGTCFLVEASDSSEEQGLSATDDKQFSDQGKTRLNAQSAKQEERAEVHDSFKLKAAGGCHVPEVGGHVRSPETGVDAERGAVESSRATDSVAEAATFPTRSEWSCPKLPEGGIESTEIESADEQAGELVRRRSALLHEGPASSSSRAQEDGYRFWASRHLPFPQDCRVEAPAPRQDAAHIPFSRKAVEDRRAGGRPRGLAPASEALSTRDLEDDREASDGFKGKKPSSSKRQLLSRRLEEETIDLGSHHLCDKNRSKFAPECCRHGKDLLEGATPGGRGNMFTHQRLHPKVNEVSSVADKLVGSDQRSSSGRHRMPKQVESNVGRTTRTGQNSSPPFEPRSRRLREQDRYPLFSMVDKPTQISEVPFMSKGQLDELLKHYARHDPASVPLHLKSLEQVAVEDPEIVEAASQSHAVTRSRSLRDLLAMSHQSRDHARTLRQLLSTPVPEYYDACDHDGPVIKRMDSKLKQGSPPKDTSAVETVCYCFVPSHVGTASSVRNATEKTRQFLKTKSRLRQLLGQVCRRESTRTRACNSRTQEHSPATFPASTVPPPAGRHSCEDEELRDCSFPETTRVSRSAGVSSNKNVPSREALGSKGEVPLGVTSNDASSWNGIQAGSTTTERMSIREKKNSMKPPSSKVSALQASKEVRHEQRVSDEDICARGDVEGQTPAPAAAKESPVSSTGCVKSEADMQRGRQAEGQPLETSEISDRSRGRKQVGPVRSKHKLSHCSHSARSDETEVERQQFEAELDTCQPQNEGVTDHITDRVSSLSTKLDLSWEAVPPAKCPISWNQTEGSNGSVKSQEYSVQTCPTPGLPAYNWSSNDRFQDSNHRKHRVKFLRHQHGHSCDCGHPHSNSESSSDKQVVTRHNMPPPHRTHRRCTSMARNLSPVPDSCKLVGKWRQYTDEGFFEGVVGLAVSSLRHFGACLIKCQGDFINCESRNVAALLHDLLPEADFAQAQDRYIGIQACLNDAIFRHFNEESYGLEHSPDCGSQGTRSRKQAFLDKFHRLSSLFPDQGILCMPHKQVQSDELQEFYHFCRSKLDAIEVLMGLTTESWPRLLLHTFFGAMKQVLRVHKLAFSMEPPVNIMHIERGSNFDGHSMELVDLNSCMVPHFAPSVPGPNRWGPVPPAGIRPKGQTPHGPACRIHMRRSSSEFEAKVEFMVTPGFQVLNRIIKSQVYLHPRA